jgi:hypothetical protein
MRWTGELDSDSALPSGRALLKYNQFVVVPGRSSGCGSETNATKDLVDALCVFRSLELREWKPTGYCLDLGPAACFNAPLGSRIESI